MTREEAYSILHNGLVNAPSEHDWCMAFEMAIQALKQEPCDDAISRQAVLNKAFEIKTGENTSAMVVYAENIRKELPVLPKREQGEWIGVNPMVDTLMCSKCGENIISEEFKSNYCPNCGAEMR